MNLVEEAADLLQAAAVFTGRGLRDEKVIVGVSGGTDSMALLHILRQLFADDQLVVAHLDHQLRATSAEDARRVAEFAAALHLPQRMGQADVAALAVAQGQSIEEAGREARYRFLAETARAEHASVVAVGHHADDQAETVLHHIVRGSGPTGLRGMQVAAPLPGAADLWLIRPLLGVTRAALITYCEANELRPVVDESNDDTSYLRNRLRHELLPALAAVNPNVRRRLIEMADVVAADFAVLQGLVEQHWSTIVLESSEGWTRLSRTGWRALPLSLRRYLLQRAVFHCRGDVRNLSFRSLEAARLIAEQGVTGDRASLPGGVELLVSYDTLELALGEHEWAGRYPQLIDSTPISLTLPGRIELAGGWSLVAERLTRLDGATEWVYHDPWQVVVAVDNILRLTLRPRLPGERFHPLGLEGHSARVKDVMINRKIPAAARARWPIVASEEHLMWLVGHQMDLRTRVTRDTRHVARLRCLPPDSLK